MLALKRVDHYTYRARGLENVEGGDTVVPGESGRLEMVETVGACPARQLGCVDLTSRLR